MNLQDFLRPISGKIMGSKILFEYAPDTFRNKDFSISLTRLFSNKERVTIFNPCEIEVAVVNRDDENRNLKFLDAVAKWLSCHSSIGFFFQIGFNSGSADSISKWLSYHSSKGLILRIGFNSVRVQIK